jgi:hypothetical protein
VLLIVNLATAEEVDDECEGARDVDEEVDDEREAEQDVDEEENDDVDVSSIITKSFDAI